MIRGLPASIIAHAAVLGASYVTFPYWSSTRVFTTELEAVDVNFAEIGEITNIAPLIETEPEEPEEVAPEEPEEVPEDQVEEEIPEAEQDVSEAEAAPAEEDPEEVLPDFEPEEPEEEPKPEPEPEKEPEPRRPQDDLADFLNQSETTFKSERATRRERPEPRTLPPEEQPQTALKDAPKPAETRNRQGSGERDANIVRLESLMYNRVKECWQGVDDLPYPERLNVKMNVELSQNGTISKLSLVSPTRRPIGSSPMTTAVDRAMRAVEKCAPYRLPKDEYEDWRDININLGLEFEPDS